MARILMMPETNRILIQKNPRLSLIEKIRFCSLLALLSTTLSCISNCGNAQSNFQLWVDGFVYQKFGKGWEYEGNIGTNRLLQHQGWADHYLCNTFSKQVKPWYMGEGSLELHETVDPLGTDVREVRPWIAQKFILPKYFEKIHLENIYFYNRLDQRFLWYPEDDVYDAKTRIRFRFGGRFLIGNKYIKENSFFIPFFFESYINLNGSAVEKYASTRRAMTGLGYLPGNGWRFELIYYLLGSRDTSADSFKQTDNIINIQIKRYLQSK